jgi:hypothetical protein
MPLLFVAAGCGGGAPVLCSLPPRTMTPPPSSAHLTGVVLDRHGLDCCTWLVDGSDGRRYEAPGLPKSVQKDGLWIAADFTFRSDTASCCMAGWIGDFTHVEVARCQP